MSNKYLVQQEWNGYIPEQMAMDAENKIWDAAVAAVKETTGVSVERAIWHDPQTLQRGYDRTSQLSLGAVTWQAFTLIRPAPTQSVMHRLDLLRREIPQGRDVLLVASLVTSLQAELLRKAGVQFIDAAGNAYLKHGGVLVSVSGRRLSKDKVVAATTPKLFYESGLKLLFAFLTTPWVKGHPERVPLVGDTYRGISAATGIPSSTVAWIMTELHKQRYVEEFEETRILVNRQKIVERWTQGYLDHLRPKLLQARFTPARMDWWKEVKLSEGLWTGEVAEAKMTGVLKPGTFVIYGDPPSHDFILRHDLQKDPEGTVEFLKPFWKTPSLNPSHPDCVHPLLVFADLLAVDDDRTREAASKLYEDHILPFISSH